MKIKINKFMELSNVNFETPAKIEAPHDGGKSTIFRAVLFATTGKDIDGKEFDGRIYTKMAKMVSDLAVEVEIEQSGVVFRKKANGSEKRQKGSDETELQRSVTCTYELDYQVVGKSVYDAKIKEVFGNFHLFCNPDYFRNLDKTAKRQIFASLVNLDRAKYFDGLGDKKTVSGKISAQEVEISKNQAILSDFLKVNKPERFETIDYSIDIQKLRVQRQNAVSSLTYEQLKKNNEINAEISSIEKMTFISEPLIPLLPEVEKPVLIDVDALKKELEKIQLSEPDTVFIDTQIFRMQVKISRIKSLTLQIENYDDNVKTAKCTLCQVCTAPDCQFKKIEITPLEDLKNELSNYMTLQEAENSLKNFESGKINYLREFEANKNEMIVSLTDAIAKATENNEKLRTEYQSKLKDIDEKNAEINSENGKITLKNLSAAASFDSEKSQKIAELKSQLHSLPAFDYSEIDEKINGLIKLQNEQQLKIDSYNEANGAYLHAQKRIGELTDEIENQKKALYALERDLIKIKDAESQYNSDFENAINSEMPKNVKISLFKKNLSNDEYSEVFDIEFDGSIYAGNGKTISFYIFICGWFQSKFGKNLPIFIDEAIILNESLYNDVKNTVVLMRNDNCKTLKISEL